MRSRKARRSDIDVYRVEQQKTLPKGSRERLVLFARLLEQV